MFTDSEKRFIESDKFDEVLDLYLYQQVDVEISTEENYISIEEKVIQSSLFNSLSTEARELIGYVFNSPVEFLNTIYTPKTGKIKKEGIKIFAKEKYPEKWRLILMEVKKFIRLAYKK